MMRNGQNNNKRMRGRNNNNNNNHHHRKNHNPLTRVYESNGPDLKIRGTAQTVAEKYVQLARDAQSSGDPVSAENYYQHAEHYFRMIAAAQEQFRQQNPSYRPEPETRNDDNFEDGDESNGQPMQNDQQFAPQRPQHQQPQSFQQRDQRPYQQRDQPYPPRDPQQQSRPQDNRSQDSRPQDSRPQEFRSQDNRQQPQPAAAVDNVHDVDQLPSFITGGASVNPPAQNGDGENPQGQNGFDNNQGERFPSHRRRRRHRGPRNDLSGAPQDLTSQDSQGADDQPGSD